MVLIEGVRGEKRRLLTYKKDGAFVRRRYFALQFYFIASLIAAASDRLSVVS